MSNSVEFCSNCGSILPLPLSIDLSSQIECRVCKLKIDVKHFDGINSHTRINFNSRDLFKKSSKKSSQNQDEDGPSVERKCYKCGHDKMTFATLQTRSADEGQTVFYTCVKCGAKEHENS